MAQIAVVLVKLVRPIMTARPGHPDEPAPRARVDACAPL